MKTRFSEEGYKSMIGKIIAQYEITSQLGKDRLGAA